ncbi:hypothetical protein WOQ_01996 [Enterococcus faecalis EnGen0340]|uniref:glycerophosphodiester phosphodiesterase n=1 Tax=Enterococcus faecalis TaxID=1351 RepID=UPI00032DFCC7|nr:glycerophosphodiester phosphodiesterase family protein [Enterococcus faecalis]EOJ97288.1 hypothetical protein WOQ_01996 [Enterococcus faecalis EnGen0340]
MKQIKKVAIIAFLIILMPVLSSCEDKNGWEWLNDNLTVLSAHRGAQTVAPENNIASIKEARRLNYKAVEIDPRENKEGDIYLLHDESVDRTTNGKGKLLDLTNSQLSKINILTDDYPQYKQKVLKVPRFEDAIKEIKKNNLIVNIDGSKGNWFDENFSKKIVDALKNNGAYEKSFFVITEEKQREYFNRLYPDACVSWLVNSDAKIEDEIKKVKKYQHALLSIPDKLASKQNIKKLNDSSIYYQVYGVNNYSRFQELRELKVKMVETDLLAP